jgi:hypothetical protein
LRIACVGVTTDGGSQFEDRERSLFIPLVEP